MFDELKTQAAAASTAAGSARILLEGVTKELNDARSVPDLNWIGRVAVALRDNMDDFVALIEAKSK